MQPPVIGTKFILPPPHSGEVTRSRLLEKLNASLSGRLTLVSAPAGFGKTTLLAGWIHSLLNAGKLFKVAWLSLDETDNAPVRFWTYLVGALQTLWPGIGQESLMLFHSLQPVPAEVALGSLVNEIATQVETDPAVLVLDDLHLISAEPIYKALAFFLDHLPARFHLVIITRTDPLLPLSRLRVRQQLTEIRAEDLRFSLSETGSFLNRTMKLTLNPADIAILNGRTEGWVAGLQMAALAMPAQNPAEFIRAFAGSNRYVLDYLLEEVLNREPEPIQFFLMQTSILGRLCGSLCNFVTGGQDGQAVLERLEAANLFLIPLDDERRWHRYHPLFAEFLAQTLRKTRPDLPSVLHRRACQWHETQGLLEEAARHVLAAGDFEHAARLIQQVAFDLLARNEVEILAGWLAALPEETIRSQPWLCVFQAWLLVMTGQGEAIEARLCDAELAIQVTNYHALEIERIQAYIAAIRAQVAFIQGAATQTIEYARFAISKLTSSDKALHATTITILGAAQSFTGELDSAIQTFEKARQISLAGGNHFNAMLALSALAQLAVIRGKLRESHRICREGLALVEKLDKTTPLPGVGYLYVGLADVLREWGELESASRYAEDGVTLCKQIGQAEILMTAYIALARVQRSSENLEAALATLQEASRVASELSVWSLESVYVHLARLWLASGDLDSAYAWLAQSGLGAETPIVFNRESALLSAARVLLAQARWREADLLLERLSASATSTGRWGSLAEILMLQGLSAWKQGKKAPARAALQRALELAEPEGYLRLFVDEGQPMRALLAECQTANSESIPYLVRLLESFGPTSTLVDPLSEREVEVLRLLALGRSNPEIANDLYISLNTVKAHVKRIFAKLESHNRTEAINRAKELKVI